MNNGSEQRKEQKAIATNWLKYALVFFTFSITTFYSCSHSNKKTFNSNTNIKDTLAPPSVTTIANLPDSLKSRLSVFKKAAQNQLSFPSPNTILLHTTPEPRIISVPKKSEGSYTVLTQLGNRTIKLSPPQTRFLPISPALSRKNGEDSLYYPEAQGRGFFTNYTSEQGLAQDAILSSIIDKRGHLWFGTPGGGVSNYNGKVFTNYSKSNGLAEDVIWCIKEDKKGNIWFGTYRKGITRYDGKTSGCEKTFLPF